MSFFFYDRFCKKTGNLISALHQRFSCQFDGVIWNTLADEKNARLFLEVRDPSSRSVSFSALNVRNNQWLWKGVTFEERWWISLCAVRKDILLLTIYTDTNNPDKKSIVAYDVLQNRLAWWFNGFSVAGVSGGAVRGTDARFPEKETILDLFTGKPLTTAESDLAESQNFPVIRPFQYQEGSAEFETVKHFLQSRVGISPTATLEYLEIEDVIVISVFLNENGLANYLYGFRDTGEMVFREKLGEDLKGVGMDTFFFFSGHLFFVKDKNELISYKIV